MKKAIETDISFNDIGDPNFDELVIESGVATSSFANPLSPKSKSVDLTTNSNVENQRFWGGLG